MSVVVDIVSVTRDKLVVEVVAAGGVALTGYARFVVAAERPTEGLVPGLIWIPEG